MTCMACGGNLLYGCTCKPLEPYDCYVCHEPITSGCAWTHTSDGTHPVHQECLRHVPQPQADLHWSHANTDVQHAFHSRVGSVSLCGVVTWPEEVNTIGVFSVCPDCWELATEDK